MKNNINKKIGATLLTAAVMTGTFVIPVAKATDAEIKAKPSVSYQAHVEEIGWQDAINSGIAGTTGQALRMEALRMKLENCENASLSFDVHIQDIGWRYNLTEEDVIGTTGKCLKMEAIAIKSKGLAEQGYKIQYRVHGENYGWTDWVDEGTVAGTTGQFLRLEAIEVRVVVDSTAVEAAKEKAVVELTNYVENSALKNTVPGSEVDYASVPAINEAVAAGYKKVAEATTVEGVANAEKEAEKAIVEATREYAQHLLNTIYNNGEEYFGLVLTNAKYEFYKEELNKAETIKDIVETYEYVVNAERFDLAKLKEEATAALTNYVENSALKNTVPGSEMDYASVPAINEAVAAGYTAINEAKTIEGPATAEKEAETAIVEATKEYAQHLLDTIYNNGEAYYGLILSESKYNAYTAGIAEATNVEDAINAYETATRERVELAKLQEEATTELTNYVENSALKNTVPGSETDYASVPAINEKIVAGYTAINATKTIEGPATELEATKTAIVEATKEYAQHLLDTIYNNGEAYYGLILSEAKYNAYTAGIAEATNVEDAINAYETATRERVELAKLQEEAVAELTNYVENSALKNTVPGSEMDYASVPAINEAIVAGYTAINEAKTIEGPAKAEKEAETAIVEATKEYAQHLLDTIYNNGEAYYGLVLSEAKYNAYTAGIAEATNVEDAINAYENATRERVELAKLQEEAVAELTNYVEDSALKNTVPGSEMDYASVPAINEAVAAGYTAIAEAKTADDVTTAVETAETAVVEATREYVQHLLNTIYNEGKPYFEMVLTNTKYEFYKEQLNNAETIKDLVETYEYVLNAERVSLTDLKANAKTELENYKNREDYTEYNAETLANAIADGKTAIEACTDKEAIDTAVAEAKAVIDAIKTDAVVKPEIEEAQAKASEALTNYVENNEALKKTVPGSESDYLTLTEINEAVVKGYSSIYSEDNKSAEAVEKAEKDAETEILKATKEATKRLVSSIYNNGEGYKVNETTYYLLSTDRDIALEAIEKAETEAEAIEAFENVIEKELIDEDTFNLEMAKIVAIEKVNEMAEAVRTAAKNEDGTEKYKVSEEKIVEVVENATNAINACEGEDAETTINAEVNKAMTALNKIKEDDEAFYNLQKDSVTKLLDIFTCEESSLNKLVPGSELKYIETPDIQSALQEGISNIWNATTSEEVDKAEKDAEASVINATKEYVKYLLGVVYENGVETTIYEDNVEVGKVQLYLPKTKYDFFLGQIENAESCKDAISEYEYVLNRNLAPEEQSLKTLEELKAYYEEKITDGYVSTAYTYTNNEAEFNKAVADSKEIINAATDLKSIEKAYEEAKATMENVATDSDINSAYNELNTKYYIALRNTNVKSDGEDNGKKYITVKKIYNKISANKGKIEASKTKTELKNTLEEAERVTVEATRAYVKELLNSIRGFNNDKYLAETDYGTALNLIETQDDVQKIINAYHTAVDARKDVSTTPDEGTDDTTTDGTVTD